MLLYQIERFKHYQEDTSHNYFNHPFLAAVRSHSHFFDYILDFNKTSFTITPIRTGVSVTYPPLTKLRLKERGYAGFDSPVRKEPHISDASCHNFLFGGSLFPFSEFGLRVRG